MIFGLSFSPVSITPGLENYSDYLSDSYMKGSLSFVTTPKCKDSSNLLCTTFIKKITSNLMPRN